VAQIRLLRIFISSPGDVADERNLARAVIKDELPYLPAFRGRVTFEVIAWDDPAAKVPMFAGETPQESVNRARPRPATCDVVVVVMWSRLGTPLPASVRKANGDPYLSGTEWEYVDASTSPSKPTVLIYRRTEEPKIGLRDPQRREKAEQFERVDQFFAQFRNPDGSLAGGVNEYDTPTDFKDLLRQHLEEVVWQRLALTNNPLTMIAAPSQPSNWTGSPYPGLRPFGTDEATIFCGRERDADGLIAHLRDPGRRFLAVVGDSGTGKSSLVYAGLLPRLKAGAFEGSSEWFVVDCKPAYLGDDPFLSLADGLFRALPTLPWERPSDLARNLRTEPASVVRTLAGTAFDRPGDCTVAILIDQLEELLSQCSERFRLPFANLLSVAAADPRCRVIATLRADYLAAAAQLEPLQELLQRGTFLLGPPGASALIDMIRKPAALVGIALSDDLVDALLADSGDGRGALPLVAFCLQQLYDTAGLTGRLSLIDYERIGRLRGALGGHADAVLRAVERRHGAAVTSALPFVFAALATVDVSGTPTRCRVPRSALTHDAAVSELVDGLIEGRLLVATDAGGLATVEVAHEVLFQSWPALSRWLESNRADLMTVSEITDDAARWERSGRNDGYLLRGDRLAIAKQVFERQTDRISDLAHSNRTGVLAEGQQRLSDRAADLTHSVREYIELSQQLQVQERTRLEELNIEAVRGREETLHERQVSLARYLASQSEAIRTQQPELVECSVLLALESLQRFRTVEADQALRRGLDLLPRAIARVQHNDEVRCLSFSPNCKFLATGGNDATALVTEVQTGREIARIVHRSDVTGVHFSSDSRLLASASMDCTVRISDFVTGKLIWEVSHDSQVYSVEFSPTEPLFATASVDNTARLWSTESGKELARFTHQDQVLTAKFSPTGRVLATASWDSSCRVWEIASGKELSCFRHEDRVLAVAFSPDGNSLLTGSMDYSMRVWNLDDGSERVRMLHDGEISDVAVNPNGKLLASASWDGTTRIWDIESGRELTRITHDGNVYAVAFSRDGQYLATAGAGHIARLFDASTGGEVARMTHDGRIHAIAFSHDSKMLASAGADHTARVWDVAKGFATPLMVHEDGVYDIKFSPDGKVLATASMDATARVWDSATGRELLRLVHDAGVNAIEFSRDGRLLATAGIDCTARVWDVVTGDEVLRVEHDFQIYAIDFTQDRRLLASGSMDSTARIWDAATGRETVRFRHTDQINDVKFTVDGRLLVTASSDCTARIWEVATGREAACFIHDGAVHVAIFNHAGTLVITGSSDRTARIWDVNSGQEIARLHHEDLVHAISLSPCERLLATASWDRTARVWSFPAGTELGILTHERQVCALDFDPKGEFLATASWDRTARVWELSTKKEIARLGHDERVYSVAFSPDGRFVATASMDCTARLRFWRTPDLIAHACGRLTRNLTDAEWRQYLDGELRAKTCSNLP
jgi:WD40 repeat protein